MKIKLAKTELIHFVGIGGIGMSGLAQVMKDMGFNVQGSDLVNSKNIERCKKIIIASAKQCHRSYFPVIKEPNTMVKWLNKPREQCFAGVIGAKSRLKKFNYNKNLPIYILIGPEGDFSVKELDLLKELGVKLFSLGNRKLRAETAAQTTLSILNEFLD